MKLKKIIDALPALQKLSAADLTLKRLYWVRKLINKLEPEVKFFDEERKKIIEKYSGTDGKIKSESIGQASAEINELLEVETEVSFTPPEIPDTENISLSNNDITALEGLVRIIFSEDNKEGEGNA